MRILNTQAWRFTVSFMVCLLFALPGKSQTPRFPMEYYTVEDGLPDPFCNHMIQDHLGYIWIGTRLGLSRYDGYAFKTYELPVPDSISLATVITFIHESQDGTLWLGSYNGLYQFDRKQGDMHYLPFPEDEESFVRYIFEDSRGQIWMVSDQSNHLHRLDASLQQLVPMDLVSDERERVKVGSPHLLFNQAPILEGKSGHLWVGSQGQGLLQYDPEKDQFFEAGIKGGSPARDTVYALLCDDRQNLLLGTPKGLVYYDPVQQSLIPFPAGDPAHGDPVYGLQADEQGRIWLQKAFSLWRFDREKETAKEYLRLPEIETVRRLYRGTYPRRGYFVWAGKDRWGKMYWVHPLNSHQFFQYDPESDAVQTFVQDFADKPDSWNRNEAANYLSGLIDHSGLLWTGYSAGLLRAQKGDNRFFTFRTGNQGLISRFDEDPSGNIWVAGKGLWLFAPENKVLTSVEEQLPGLSRDQNLAANFLHYDQQGDLWFTREANLYRLVLNDDPFVNLALGKEVKASSVSPGNMHLPDYAIDGDLKTRWTSEGADPQWLELDLGKQAYVNHMVVHWEACYATDYKILISDDGKSWRTAFENSDGQGGKEKIFIRQKGRYLRMAGKQRSSPYCYSIWEWEVHGKTPLQERLIPVPENREAFARCIMEDRKHRLWIGLAQEGLVRYDQATGQLVHYPLQEWRLELGTDLLSLDAIQEGPGGELWLQGWQPDRFGTLAIFDPEKESLHFVREAGGDSMPLLPGVILGTDRQGEILLSGEKGIFRYQSKTRSLDYLTDFPIVASTSWVDNQDRIWVGSLNKGIYLIDPRKKRVKNYTTQDGLAFDNVQTLQADEQGRLWIGTERGLSCFYPEEERFEHYTAEDGLFGNALRFSFKDSQGRLYFGGPGGFSFFDPDKLQSDTTQAQLVISNLQINNQTVHPGTEGSPLTQAISETRSLDLAHDQNVITLGFTALHYAQSEKNRYQVRLIGLDTAWVDLGTQRSMNYAGLSPGRYTFEAKASNADGVWTSTPASLEITIHPPWWRSYMAFGVYILLLLATVYAFVRWRTTSLRRQRELLRSRVFEQTRELRLAKQTAEAANEAKSTFLSTVSHELRTPLTSIIGFTKLNKKNLEEKVLPKVDPTDTKTHKAAQRISKNLDVVSSEGERLTHLINELLDLAKIESGKMEWKMAGLNPAELIERAVNATSALFAQKPSLDLITEIPTDLPKITGDRNRLLQVLINLISNAVKFTDSGYVKVGARQTNHSRLTTLDFYVEDTGSGIPPDQLHKIFERFQQVEHNQTGKPKGTGLGLPICKEIVGHHRGQIWVESEIEKGSIFSFSLPIGRSDLQSD